jgi:hypothetical protein
MNLAFVRRSRKRTWDIIKKRAPRGPNSKVIGVTRLIGEDQSVTMREFPDGRAKVLVPAEFRHEVEAGLEAMARVYGPELSGRLWPRSESW